MDLHSVTAPCRKTLVLAAVIALSLMAFAAIGQTDRAELLEQAKSLRNDDPEAALKLLDRALADQQTDRYSARELATVAGLLEMRAAVQRGRAEYDAASADAQRLGELAKRSNEPGLAADAAFLQGSIEAERGQFAAALDRFHAARRRLEGIDRPVELARIFNAIGVTHNFTGDQARAREYFQRAVDAARDAGAEGAAATYLGNLSLTVAELEGPRAALPMLREVLQLSEETGAETTATMARANLCDQLVKLEEHDEAETTCLAALDEVDRMHQARWQAGIRLTLGHLRRDEGRLEEAVDWYREALAIASASVPTIEDEVLASLSEALEDLGQTAEALTLTRQRVALRDQQRQSERRELVEELEVRYEVERSEADLELLRLQSALQKTQLQQRNMMLMALLIGLAVTLLAAIGAVRSYWITTRLKRDLATRNSELEQAVAEITDLARHDSLTGLFNRRALEELGQREVNRQQRHGEPLSVMLMDIDYFKSINDRFGHAVGDEVLQSLAALLRENLRDTDLVGRWGGEEFLCILPKTDLAEAEHSAHRIQSALEAAPIQTAGDPVRLTVTCGIAAVDTRLDQAIQRADQAMYRGKHEGRNVIVVAGRGAPDPG
ncbi:tetratricopeptide repeat-containing diguanylate cyclase [Wenzhouxiangella limi]|uniref:diguanylate cyclase n=1 Tax=Wenzhouxiangella limi TaxID=2707351 RepID=A0A845UWY8_9GAMM|nr:tetratricopeptide repeat-containing diguanylate cyclase [Wenzhouxiangella limi]NDY95168.1 GGDEF domain-containing protein [Wenzhouxiangella limi]